MRLSPRAAVWLYAAVVAALAAHFLVSIPIQLSDSLQNIFAANAHTVRELFVNQLWGHGYMRPLLFAPFRLVFVLSHGDYTPWFRGVHAVQLTLLVAATVAALRVRTWAEASAAPVALAMLLSLHTFADTILEAFPVNAYLTIVLCCVLAVLVARAPHRWWSDVVAVALLVVGALSVESGLLVGVIVVAGYGVGWRGVSRWGLVAVCVGLAGYLGARYFLLNVGTPGLDERSTGFGLAILDPREVQARFGAHPLPLYAYNVLASIGSLLFAEPRGGVFWVTRAALRRDLAPWMFVNVVACTATSVLLVTHVIRGWDRWRRWQLSEADRMIAVFVVVLAANGTMNLVYTKDVIMSPAGALFALAAAGALSVRLEAWTLSPRRWTAGALVAVLAFSWGIKMMGVHYSLRESAHRVRKDWAYADGWLETQEVRLDHPGERAIKERLMADALWQRPALPRIEIHWRWPGSWFDTTQ